MRTAPQLQAIARTGGMIAVMTKDDFQDTDNKGKKLTVQYPARGRVYARNDCRHSTKTWAQMLQYSVDILHGPVALGSDFNGVAGHVGPRFGQYGCGGNAAEKRAQGRTQLRYPFTLAGFGTFSKQVTGSKTFDFNVHGLAHVGLIPDMIADVMHLGLPRSYTDQVFRSAEKYIQVWEQSCRQSRNPRACLGR